MTEPAAAFSPTLPAGGLYIGTALRQRIDLIEHLLEFGHQMILLCGGPASGKSTLLASLAAEAGARWQCVDVRGGPALGGRMLLESVAEAAGVGVEPTLDDGTLLERVRQRAAQAERAGKLLVLLVDDADQLPPETVAMLLALARHDDAGAEPRVLMTADQDHGALLGGLQRDDPQHGLVHVIEIPPLNEAQVEAFLAQRARAVGLELEDCLDADTLAAVAAEAQGNPGQVLALARQAASGQLPTRSSAPGAGLIARLSHLGSVLSRRSLMVGATVLGAIVLGALLWLGRPPEAPSSAPEASSDGTAASAAPAESPAAPEAGSGERKQIEISLADSAAPPPASTAVPPPEGVASVAPTGNEPTATPDASTPATSTTDAPPSAPEAAAAPASPAPAVPSAPEMSGAAPAAAATAGLAAAAAAAERSSRSAPAKQSTTDDKKAAAASKKPLANADRKTKANGAARTAKAETSERPAKSAKPAARPVAPTSKPVQRKAKPASGNEQPASKAGYTLQLIGVKDRAAASEFIRRHQLGKEARIIETRRNGQPWFTVAYGSYASRAAAEAAAAGLPASARRATTPWVRALNGRSKPRK